jgi:hypothetical protein
LSSSPGLLQFAPRFFQLLERFTAFLRHVGRIARHRHDFIHMLHGFEESLFLRGPAKRIMTL